jgi:hypothetical protein
MDGEPAEVAQLHTPALRMAIHVTVAVFLLRDVMSSTGPSPTSVKDYHGLRTVLFQSFLRFSCCT